MDITLPELLLDMLDPDPNQRICIAEILAHPLIRHRLPKKPLRSVLRNRSHHALTSASMEQRDAVKTRASLGNLPVSVHFPFEQSDDEEEEEPSTATQADPSSSRIDLGRNVSNASLSELSEFTATLATQSAECSDDEAYIPPASRRPSVPVLPEISRPQITSKKHLSPTDWPRLAPRLSEIGKKPSTHLPSLSDPATQGPRLR
jgi:hypothetical protein